MVLGHASERSGEPRSGKARAEILTTTLDAYLPSVLCVYSVKCRHAPEVRFDRHENQGSSSKGKGKKSYIYYLSSCVRTLQVLGCFQRVEEEGNKAMDLLTLRKQAPFTVGLRCHKIRIMTTRILGLKLLDCNKVDAIWCLHFRGGHDGYMTFRSHHFGPAISVPPFWSHHFGPKLFRSRTI